MTPVGYLAKKILSKPDWLKADGVIDIYSVSGCLSKDFTDYISFWKHNGYWLFNSPQVIEQLAKDHSINLDRTTMFYYEVHEMEFNEKKAQWRSFESEDSFVTDVLVPATKTLEGYDAVNFTAQTSRECSPLSCHSLASSIQTNSHCLLSSFEDAKRHVETGSFNNSEPGPYRIFAVYTLGGKRRSP